MKGFLLCILPLFSMIACTNIENKDAKENSTQKDSIAEIKDTAKYEIIMYDSSRNVNKDKYKPTTLSQIEIIQLENLIDKSIAEFNRTWSDKIKRSEYKCQYSPVINGKGEKEVWIYCACDGYFGLVLDGGDCYFNLHVNLSQKTYTEIEINSMG